MDIAAAPASFRSCSPFWQLAPRQLGRRDKNRTGTKASFPIPPREIQRIRSLLHLRKGRAKITVVSTARARRATGKRYSYRTTVVGEKRSS